MVNSGTNARSSTLVKKRSVSTAILLAVSLRDLAAVELKPLTTRMPQVQMAANRMRHGMRMEGEVRAVLRVSCHQCPTLMIHLRIWKF